ncbi:hypothetical protein [Nostoc sp. CHAB 5836]|uniref:hypothetical protein n=1 Tax=Nostoc sp. CHAB 5836 TaxID=2780404 RepID=UPI001E4E0DA6|nr:hypothetical protein [Nostoc sp. CHAB 5836]
MTNDSLSQLALIAPTYLGELVLVYNENLEFIDENWLLDIDSSILALLNFKA